MSLEIAVQTRDAHAFFYNFVNQEAIAVFNFYG